MKLGICYMVFDGEELLEFAVKSIRNCIDYIAVTYQTTSYYGNQCTPNLISTLNNLYENNLIDELVLYEPNLSIDPKRNELVLRNLGLELSKKAGCTHHISADVDEFYDAKQLEYAKFVMENDDYDFSIASLLTYYKNPTYLVYPSPKLRVSFIHPVENKYDMDIGYPEFPFKMEITRRFSKSNKYKIFTEKEFIIHHMSYVRKDIRKKFNNSSNGKYYNIKKFELIYNQYKLGDRVSLLPDFKNRRTIEVENKFNIVL